jgi:hypothetical protein
MAIGLLTNDVFTCARSRSIYRFVEGQTRERKIREHTNKQPTFVQLSLTKKGFRCTFSERGVANANMHS